MTVSLIWQTDHCVFVVTGRLERGHCSDMIDSLGIGDKIKCETSRRADYYARLIRARNKKAKRTTKDGAFYLTRIE